MAARRRPRTPRGASPRRLAREAARSSAGEAAARALSLVRALQTIESAYEAWDEVRASRARFTARLEAERRQLDDEAELLLGAVRAATAGGPAPATTGEGLAPADAATRFLADAREKLDDAKARLTREASAAEDAFSSAEADIQGEARARIEAQGRLAPPHVRLYLRTVGAAGRVLHLERPSPDDAVVLFFLVSGRIPSRYAAPFDDSVDSVQLGATSLYPDAGIPADALHPEPAGLRAALEARDEVWPLKGGLAQLVPGPRLLRWVTRGPVLEAELEDGAAFRSVLTTAEAESVTGELVKLQLAGRLALELARG